MNTTTPYEVSATEANAALRKIYEHAEDDQISARDAFQSERGKLAIDLARQAGIALPIEAASTVDAIAALTAAVQRQSESLERIALTLELLTKHITGR